MPGILVRVKRILLLPPGIFNPDKNIDPRAGGVYVESRLCHLLVCDLVFLNFQIVFLIYKMGIIMGPTYRWL